jgi:two-component system sensor histidine kinase DesK
MRIRAGVLLGLLFLAGPMSDLAGADVSNVRLAFLAAGSAVFVALYTLLLVPPRWLYSILRGHAIVAGLAVMLVLIVALLLGGAPGSFVALFVYFVAVAGLLLRTELAIPVLAGTAVATAIASLLTDQSDSALGAQVLTVIGIGAMTAALGRKTRANIELRAAREELARLAVAEERLRIARDVHDLLGHSLSVIALKSELAAKLVDRDPQRAAAELADINAVSRTALAEVRETVHGYRTLALDEALGGARSALAAAGIGYELHEAGAALPPAVEGVFAWAIREGATNVVRHSGATRCAIRIEADADNAALEVEDDGSAVGTVPAGSGLRGLAERAERLRGRLEAGAKPDGGFRLRLTVPLTS